MSQPAAAPDGAVDLSSLQPLATSKELEASPDLGPVPVFAWVAKTLLAVDRRYQRDAIGGRSRELIRGIVEGMRWDRFQPITVTPAAEGRYAVIDGQHSTIAALMHPAVTDVPCWIVEAPDLRRQARTFGAINRDRVKMSTMQMYKAALAGGDPDATQIDKVCRAAGVQVAFWATNNVLPPCQTLAVETLRELLRQYGEGPVGRALGVMAEAWAEAPNAFRAQVIKGVALMVKVHGPRLDLKRLARVLADREAGEMIDAARVYKRAMGGSTEAAICAGLVRAYDKGLAAAARLAPVAA